MELAVTTVDVPSNRSTWTIHHLTDLHMDDSDHAEKELDARIAEIAADPQALWLGGGDYGSLILPNDPRFQTSRNDLVHRLPDRYIERMEERFAPIVDKCIGLGSGNHEATIGKHYHRGVIPEAAMRLGVPEKYLGVRGWAIVTFKRKAGAQLSLRCYQYHGWSTGRLKGRKALQAERDLGAWDADALFLGHDHQPYADAWYTEEPYCSAKAGWKLRQRPRAVINGGSWTYGQRPPLENKGKLKPSEFPNEPWVEGRNFRPQPPENPVLLVEVDFGSGANANGSGSRSAGFDFEIRRRARRYDVG